MNCIECIVPKPVEIPLEEMPEVIVSLPSADYVVDDYYASHPLLELPPESPENPENPENPNDVESELVNENPSESEYILPCQSVNKYRKIMRLSEGSYGVVYKAENIATGEIVALKRVFDLVVFFHVLD